MKNYLARNGKKYYLEQIKNIKGVKDGNGNPFTEQQDLDSWMYQESGANKITPMKFVNYIDAIRTIETGLGTETFECVNRMMELHKEPNSMVEHADELRELNARFSKACEEIEEYLKTVEVDNE